MNNSPKHIAIIMDGNGRWAKKYNRPRIFGHKEGVSRVNEIVEFCAKNDFIEVLTLYTFSLENWLRPKREIDGLMNLILSTIDKYIVNLISNGIKIKIIGDINALPEKVQEKLFYSIESTKDNDKLILNLAINYGSRQEIVNAIKLLYRDIRNGLVVEEEINEELFSTRLNTYPVQDPDLLIRTGGEYRLSNFLLWQLSYAEIVFNNKYWPDYSVKELKNDINTFNKRERRFGKISEQL